MISPSTGASYTTSALEMPACGIASIMLLIITDIGRTCAMDASVSFPVRKLRTCPFASGVSRSAPLRVGVSRQDGLKESSAPAVVPNMQTAEMPSAAIAVKIFFFMILPP